MDTRHLVDPELVESLDNPTFPPSHDDLEKKRSELIESRRALFEAEGLPDGIAMEARVFAGPPGAPDVRVLVFTQCDREPNGAGYLHIHGGGYVVGAADASAQRCGIVAKELGCTLVSVDYRLAPETPFPGPLEDCYAALGWFHREAEALGVDTSRIAIGGESAGGGLAAGLALLARDRGEYPICFQMLSYPMIEDRGWPADDPHPFTGEFVWTVESNVFGWNAYLGDGWGGPDIPAYGAAARATDLAGLPPAFIGVGALDLFLEEDIQYAARLMRAGVPTELHVYPGAFHGFDMWNGDAAVSRQYHQDIFRALKRGMAIE